MNTPFRAFLRLGACLLPAVCLAAVASAQGHYGKAADNKIYAQALVNEVKAANPDMIAFGIHAIAPGASEYTIVAHTVDIIGKPSEPDDILIATQGRLHLVPNPKQSNAGMMLPLKDASGNIVGATLFIFPYKAGDDELALLGRARTIVHGLSEKIQNHDELFNLRAADPIYSQSTRTLGQALVEELPQKYPDVEYGVMHALLPGGKGHAVIASHRLAQVGEPDSETDNAVSDEQCIVIHPDMKSHYARCIVRIPMKAASGDLIRGAWAISFKSKPGDDPMKFGERAMEVRDEMAKEIPNPDALYKPDERPHS